MYGYNINIPVEKKKKRNRGICIKFTYIYIYSFSHARESKWAKRLTLRTRCNPIGCIYSREYGLTPLIHLIKSAPCRNVSLAGRFEITSRLSIAGLRFSTGAYMADMAGTAVHYTLPRACVRKYAIHFINRQGLGPTLSSLERSAFVRSFVLFHAEHLVTQPTRRGACGITSPAARRGSERGLGHVPRERRYFRRGIVVRACIASCRFAGNVTCRRTSDNYNWNDDPLQFSPPFIEDFDFCVVL